MRFFGFFERCKTLRRVLTVISICVGLILGLHFFRHFDTVPSFVFGLGCCFFIMLILTIILLSCIIKDAEEDLTAILKLSENKISEE